MTYVQIEGMRMLDAETSDQGQAADATSEVRTVRWSKWSPELIALLREQWQDGLSASEIAALIRFRGGPKFTRNAVIGKLHRLGLSAADVPGFKSQVKSKRGAARRSTTAKRKGAGTYSPVEAGSTKRIVVRRAGPRQAPSQLTDLVADREPMVASVVDLEPQHCRWPVKGGFCGCVKLAGSSYCAEHHARAHRYVEIAPISLNVGKAATLGMTAIKSMQEFTAP